jgi:hypothetical protein
LDAKSPKVDTVDQQHRLLDAKVLDTNRPTLKIDLEVDANDDLLVSTLSTLRILAINAGVMKSKVDASDPLLASTLSGR